MKSVLKKTLVFPFIIFDFIFNVYSHILSFLRENLKNIWLEYQKENVNTKIQSLIHKNSNETVKLQFYTPNAICRMRADTFSTKEPETLEWLDKYNGQGVFFDIGANIGLYSIYFAKTKNLVTYAFEPSVFNLGLLAKNCYLNNVHDKIKIIPNPLSDKTEFSNFNLSTIDEGGALSAFGVDFGWDGTKMKTSCTYQSLGFSLDELMKNKIIDDFPSLIKLDVDGIEHIILRGARQTLSDERCRTILIEINDKFVDQALETKNILIECGFILTKKKQSVFLKSDNEYSGIHNQIWIKK